MSSASVIHLTSAHSPLDSRLWTDTIVLQTFFMPLVRKYNIGGKRLQRFVMSNLTWGSVKKLTDVVNVMHQTSLEIYEGGKQFVATGGEKNVLSALSKSSEFLRYARH